MNAPFPIRKECPPGACVCNRQALLNDPQADLRILKLTREEESRLLARLEALSSLTDLKKMESRLHEQLGIVLTITPSIHEVRTLRGISIQLQEQPGLCRKTKQAIPAAIRRSLEKSPDIAYAILDAHGLWDGA